MTTMSKTALGIAAGVCGTLFLGYCIYFDRQRRSDPNFKKKLRARRKAVKSSTDKRSSSKFPDLSSQEQVQKFFLQEVQLGEVLLANGDVEEGVEHLGNAVTVCGQPTQLLQVFQQTLPQEIFQLLIQRLPSCNQKLMSQLPSGGGGGGGGVVTEDDVE